MSKGDLYSRIAASAPVDASAARALSMRGEHEPTVKIPEHHEHYDAPPKVQPVPENKTDRTGRRFGKLTVIGYLRTHRDRSGRWLVRCVCGQYEVRRGSTIDKADAGQSCTRCAKLAWHRSAEYQGARSAASEVFTEEASTP